MTADGIARAPNFASSYNASDTSDAPKSDHFGSSSCRGDIPPTVSREAVGLLSHDDGLDAARGVIVGVVMGAPISITVGVWLGLTLFR